LLVRNDTGEKPTAALEGYDYPTLLPRFASAAFDRTFVVVVSSR